MEELKRLSLERQVTQMKRTAHARLPFNSQLVASNVAEFDVPLEVVEESRRLYEQHIQSELALRATSAEEAKGNRCHKWQSGDLRFFVRPVLIANNNDPQVQSPNPKQWKYSIDWVYPEDLATRQVFQSLFDRLKVLALTPPL